MKSLLFKFFFLCCLLVFVRPGGAGQTRVQQKKVSVQLGLPLWFAHVPKHQLAPLINHHAEMTVSLVTRPALYGQSVSFEKVLAVNGKKVDQTAKVAKNTYAFTSPCTQWTHLMGEPRDVMSSVCCFKRPRTVTVPQYVKQQVVISVGEVLKVPVESCPVRSGANRKNNLQAFIRELDQYPFVTHIVHHDFNRSDNPGRGGMYPMMKQVILASSMSDSSPYKVSSRLSAPDKNSVHLFHLMQNELPIQPISTEGGSTETIDEIDDSDADNVQVTQTYQKIRKPDPAEIAEAYELIKKNRPASVDALKGGSVVSCPTGGVASPTTCYQDDLLGTDCSTTILKVNVRRSGDVMATGLVIVPGHENDDVVVLFAGSDDDNPPPDDDIGGAPLSSPRAFMPGPATPRQNLPQHQFSLWSVMTALTQDDEFEGELERAGLYRRSYKNMRLFKDYFDREDKPFRSFRRDPDWGGGGGGFGGGIISQ